MGRVCCCLCYFFLVVVFFLWNSAQGKTKREVFLFNDIIIIGSKVPLVKKYKYKATIDLKAGRLVLWVGCCGGQGGRRFVCILFERAGCVVLRGDPQWLLASVLSLLSRRDGGRPSYA